MGHPLRQAPYHAALALVLASELKQHGGLVRGQKAARRGGGRIPPTSGCDSKAVAKVAEVAVDYDGRLKRAIFQMRFLSHRSEVYLTSSRRFPRVN